MKLFRFLVVIFACAALVSCSDRKGQLEKLIPSDVAGVVCINVPNILEKSEIKQGDDLVIPESLKNVIDANDEQTFGQLVKAVPNLGVEIKDKAYLFFPNDTYDYVALIAIDEEDKAKTLISHKTGEQFADIEGVSCVKSDDSVWCIEDGVLFCGKLRGEVKTEKAVKWAKSILDYEGKSIGDTEIAKDLVDADKELTAYLDMQKFGKQVRSNVAINSVLGNYPILQVLIDSDIKSVKMKMSFDGNKGDVDMDIAMDENGEFATMMKTLLQKPSNTFLKAIPNTMKLVVSTSVNGKVFAEMPQVKKMIKMVNDMPFLGRLDISAMVSAIDGPVAVGVATDPVFSDEYNYVFAARTMQPSTIIDLISTFASSFGQEPELYQGEYIYAYNNKQVRVGVIDDVVYVKMLNYEQTEPNCDGDKQMNDFFSQSLLGAYCQIENGGKHSTFSFGLKNAHSAKGSFVTEKNESAILQFLQFLCSIKPVNSYDYDMDEIEGSADNMIGEFQSF